MEGVLATSLLVGGGCSTRVAIPGVVRPAPGAGFLESLPGPMPEFGPFDDAAEALGAACSLFLSKPNASVGHIKDPEVARRTSAEYCAWLYATPDQRYQMSMMTDQSDSDDPQRKRRTCRLPAYVEDARFSAWDIKYIFALHNHPFGGPLSLNDMRQIIAFANVHEWVVETKTGRVPLAIVAFSRPDRDVPSCDGFYQYTPETRDLLRFIRKGEEWLRQDLGKVTWLDKNTFLLNGREYHQ